MCTVINCILTPLLAGAPAALLVESYRNRSLFHFLVISFVVYALHLESSLGDLECTFLGFVT